MKVAEAAPAATVTEAGTVRERLALVRVTLAPPIGAGWERLTVHTELPPLLKLAGRQARDVTCGKIAPPVTAPPVADTSIAFPAGEDAVAWLTWIAVVVEPAAIVRYTLAMAPFGIMLPFIAEATQVYVPLFPEQVNVFPAAEAAAPEITESETTLAGRTVNVHSMAEGSLPAGELKTKFSATAPLDAAVPDERVSWSWPACPKEILRGRQIAIISPMEHRNGNLVIEA
jgi:hypothetical protein